VEISHDGFTGGSGGDFIYSVFFGFIGDGRDDNN
jgi:hypothetical protein